jgi:ribosome-associated translation inhibitor RaiA
MRITITARHADVPAELRARARALLARLGRVASRPHDGQVVFGADHGRAAVEVRLHRGRQRVHVARAEGPDHRTALDRAAGRLRRQLDKATPSRRRAAGRTRG